MNNRHFLRRDSFRRLRGPAVVKSSTDSHVEFTWTPELFGPLFGAEKITLWQALRNHLIDRRTKLMASFVPDELIYTLDLTKKYLNTFIGVVLLIDISSCHEFCYMKNNGSYGMTKLFNSQICSIIESVYFSHGDIINFESHGIMAMWKVQKFELAFKTVELVIKCALTFKEMSKNINNITPIGFKLRMSISIGDVGFSVIGNDNGRHWILIGKPVEDVRTLIKNCNASDVILTEDAWDYVSPNNYEYVLSDEHSIKIISETESFSKSARKLLSSMDSNSQGQQKAHETSNSRLAIVDAVSRKLIDKLRSFLVPGLVDYIEKDRLLNEFCHNRRVTILSINIVPIKCNNLDLLDLCDECFSNLFRLTSEYSGRIETVIAHSKAIFFSIIFGPLIGDINNTYTNGIICAEKCLKILNNVKEIKKLSIGVSTGVVLYTIVGDLVRHACLCLGLPVDKSEKIVAVSNQKLSCDFDTVLCSDIPRTCFRLRSTRGITTHGRFNIYELHNSDWTEGDHWVNRNIHEIYPIIGRFDEVEKFTDALDEINFTERNYCGFLVEGPDGVGKSRLLDEFVMIANSRQISTHKIFLNSYDSARILKKYNQNNPGWCEILISLMLERKWLDFQYPDRKRNIKDLISPPVISVAKVPYGIFPDEINHDVPYYKRRSVDINSESIVRLIEARIIECASIQRFSYNTSPYTRRSTFSDMHHIYNCACYRTNVGNNNAYNEEQVGVPDYAHCKLLEFKSKDFRQFIYSKMSPSQQNNLHTIVAGIYERQAKKCYSCGGGSFFKTPNTSQTIGIGRPSSIMRQSIFREIAGFKRRERSVSVGSQESHDAIISEPDEETASVIENNKRKLEKIFDVKNDPSRRSQLKKFNMIDFRNCECEKIILEIYMELVRHVEKLGDLNKLVKWTTELAAGLIQIYRYTEAFKLLVIAKEHNENLSGDKQCTNIIIILGLMGDASAALGNNSEAKKYFGDVIKLQKNEKFLNNNLKVYNKVNRYWRRRFKKYFENLFITKLSQSEISKRIIIAHNLIKLSKVYLSEGEFDLAESVALNAFNIGFSHPYEGFIDKCTLYINATIIFRTIGEYKFIQQLEKQIIKVMRKKCWWSNIDEILSVVHVFQLMFELRFEGEYKNAYNIGMKILKISGTLHLTGITLIILPLLIQLAIRMKRVYQTADLMGQLYYLSVEDIDESSITWYYSLALDLALDAGMALEPFEKSVQHGLGCYLLLLKHQINIKNSTDLPDLLKNINLLLDTLEKLSYNAWFIKPRYYMLKAYFKTIRGDKYTAMKLLKKGRKYAISQGNQMMTAWILQCETTFRMQQNYNMAQYWNEHMSSADKFNWRNIHEFDVKAWSTILYPIPVPESCL
ncbi:hypothetical protein PV328_003188 [Microctonus aethiopoides]|uniref:Adenylate cyclase type 10 n=1 Tax=Microctonus aethiopoides TaxID=144406 RepID=A0AA39KK78_9HYME|nr:hypothetical protein PV328_003188 [Microctonus aethiopoides]